MQSKYSSQQLERMGRRRYLKTLSAIGVSPLVQKHLSQGEIRQVTSNPKEEVPRIELFNHTNHEEIVEGIEQGNPVKPKKEPVYYTIPREEWVVNQAPFNGARKLACQNDVFDNAGIIPRVTTRVSGQHSERIIQVSYRILHRATGETLTPEISYEEFQNKIPASINATVGTGQNQETVENIPVTTRQEESTEMAYFDHTYQPDVPGGCEIEGEVSPSHWMMEFIHGLGRQALRSRRRTAILSQE